jgi:hypothetical protein
MYFRVSALRTYSGPNLVLLCAPAGDTHPTTTLDELAEGTDILIQQIMGPLPPFNTLSFESQYLLNVSITFHPSSTPKY